MELKFGDTNKIFGKQSKNESPDFKVGKTLTGKSSHPCSAAHSSF